MIILFNADDFGLTKGITDGIITSFTNGVIGSTTMMMNGRATNYAIKQAKEHPTLKVGIHLVLSWGKPLLHNHVPDLINDRGEFKFTNQFEMMKAPPIDQVEKEWQAQIEAFLATGLRLHHIDSHHHIHGWLPLKNVIIKLAKKYHVPVRYVDALKSHPKLLLTETLWTDFYHEGITMDVFSQLRELKAHSIEVMTHPAYVDDDLKRVSSYTIQRKKELDILCKIKVPDWATLLK